MNGGRKRDERNLTNFVNIFACQFIIIQKSHWTLDDLFKSMRKRIKDHHFMDGFPKYLSPKRVTMKTGGWRLSVFYLWCRFSCSYSSNSSHLSTKSCIKYRLLGTFSSGILQNSICQYLSSFSMSLKLNRTYLSASLSWNMSYSFWIGSINIDLPEMRNKEKLN